jgi:small-conductance mechanosensitive channel
MPASANASAEATPEPTDVIDPPELEGSIRELSWWLDLVTGPILRALVIVVAAFVLRFVFVRVVDRFVANMSKPRERATSGLAGSMAREVIGRDSIGDERRALRAQTIGQLLKNVGSVLIATIATLMVLAEFGFNLAPLIASAGIIGVALAFGAQTLVADFLSGVFMLLEDQYGVGDVIDMGEATGVVEDVQLRVTRLRSVDGTVWYIRNGEVVRVGNMSQNWSRAVIDVGVGYSSDVAMVRDVLADVAETLAEDEEWAEKLLETPEIWGVENLGPDSVVVRVVLKTRPGQQWAVARELRERIHARLNSEGIEIPFPQRTVWVRNEE